MTFLILGKIEIDAIDHQLISYPKRAQKNNERKKSVESHVEAPTHNDLFSVHILSPVSILRLICIRND